MGKEIKVQVRSVLQQAIDNLKAIVNSKDKIIEIEPPIEDTAQILLDYITNLQESEAYYYGYYKDYKSRCEKSLKALHNSKEYKVMKELEFNKNMSILIKLDKLLGGDDNE